MKIIKIQQGIFKHVYGVSDENVFFNTKKSSITIDNDTITINSGYFSRNYHLGQIQLFDIGSVTPITIVTVDNLITELNRLGYPLLSKDSYIDEYLSVSITGRVRDSSLDMQQNFEDGTTQTIYFTTSGDYAGKSKRQ